MKAVSRRCVLTAVVAVLVGAIGQTRADTIVYATISANGATNSTFGFLDLTTGQFTASANLSITVGSMTTGANGTVYAAAFDGNLYTIGAGGTVTRFGSVSAPVNGGSQTGYFGLADAGANGLYGLNINNIPDIDHIAANGNSVSSLASLTNLAATSSGSLAFGPDGALYLTASSSTGVEELFRVNTTTGVATAVGTGLQGTDSGLALVSVGGTLYGIDAVDLSGSAALGIYAINTTTGVATATGVDVTGLPVGYTFDSAASVPEPTPLVMALTSIAGGLGVLWNRRRKVRTHAG